MRLHVSIEYNHKNLWGVLMANQNLTNAKKAKKDEFYTRWEEIEKEVNAYIEYNKDVFKGKIILLPADDPFESNFFKYFAVHFNDYGLKKLIATSYDPSPVVNQQLSLFGDDEEERAGKAYKIELTHVEDFNHDGVFNIQDVERFLESEKINLNSSKGSKVLNYLNGDSEFVPGDFRSKEVTKLRNEADIIITNPPFSLFREFMKWVNPLNKKVLVIGNLNAITYKEIFPLIKNNELWLGATNFNTGMYFNVPDNFEYKKSYHFIREIDGQKVNRVPGVCWFTNLDHGRRHQPLSLMSMADNIKFSKHNDIKEWGYMEYANYDAIEVPHTDAIPNDYNGKMGVPVTFLDKFNPDQFEIIGCGDYKGQYGSDYLGIKEIGEEWLKKYREQGGKGHYTANMNSPVYYLPDGTAKPTFKRIFVKIKNSVEKD